MQSANDDLFVNATLNILIKLLLRHLAEYYVLLRTRLNNKKDVIIIFFP